MNCDTGPGAFHGDVRAWEASTFAYADEPGSQIDSIWFCFDEGNLAFYPSKVLPMSQCPQIKKFWDRGVDMLQAAVSAGHRRGLEVFYTYRLNGYDNEISATGEPVRPIHLPMKDAHPEWLLADSWPPDGAKLWNFDIKEVRDYKVRILRELAQNYDWDGLDIDFARHPPSLPIGRQWNCRDSMTDFVRGVRQMLSEVAQARGRPYLLSVRVPETLQGCHYDGYDIETWVRQGFVDILVLGPRPIAVDLEEFKRITVGTKVKVYPCMDDYAHPPDGYSSSIELERGIASNWWRQGADGICTFNWLRSGTSPHQQAYHEIGDPEAIRFLDKFFVVPRRHGAGWDETWNFYQNTNIEAPLPAKLTPGDLPAIFHAYVGDDLPRNADRVGKVELRLRLSNSLPAGEIVVKLNGVLLSTPDIQSDWQVFHPLPKTFALGRNILSVRTSTTATIEKIEIHVSYNK